MSYYFLKYFMSYYSPQSPRNSPPSNRQFLTIIGLLIALVILFFYLLSWLFNSIVDFMPPEVEQKLGQVIVPVYEKQALNSPVQTELNQLLDRLESKTEFTNSRDFQVLYIPDSTVNAIAIPGDRIIIYRGLLKNVQSENELMMILGHELGHFAHRDHLRGIAKTLVWQIAIATFLGDTSWLTGQVATITNAVANAQFSQKQEKQADEYGLILLNRVYNHVGGAKDFFLRLSQQSNLNIDFLASHPAPIKRVKNIEKIIKQKRYKQLNKTPLSNTLKNF